MSDLRGLGGGAEEDRLPWLEPVEEDFPEDGISAGRLIVGLCVALIALGLIVGGVYWLKQRATGAGAGGGTGDSTLITAQSGPIKVKPVEAGGLQVKGQDGTIYSAAQGGDPAGVIDLKNTPETPIAKTKPVVSAPPPPATPSQPASAPLAANKPMAAKVPIPPAQKPPVISPKPTPPPTEVAATSGGTQVQLGAFGSEAKANQVWKSLSSRFPYLASLNQSVAPATVNGKTLYRLRAAAGSQASVICSKLKVAGEACAVIG